MVSTMRFSGLTSAVLFCLVALVVPYSARAITLDSFERPLTVEAFAGIPDSGTIATTAAIGGYRSLSAEINVSAACPGGSLEVQTRDVPANAVTPFHWELQHSQATDACGTSVTHWDGNGLASSIDYTGLGGMDLTEDGSTGFILKSLDYDAAAIGSEILIRAYDASDDTGETFSEFSLVIPSGQSGNDFELLFNTPTATGTNGPADFTNIGALAIVILGVTEAADISIDLFKTNGPCDLTPTIGGKVLDDCGECLPPSDPLYNQSCVDCLGVPNGDTLPGDSCTTNELGPCSEGMYNNQCDCIRVIDPTVEVCDGADNNCNGEIDETFVLLGNECGVLEDDCEVTGIYICNDQGGMKCEIDYSRADLDKCDVEIGCDGVPGSGMKPDDCGVCGGDGSTCADLGCESTDISHLLFDLDGGAKVQEAQIRSITRIIRRETKRKRIRKSTRAIRAEAHTRQIANWVLSWTLPIISVQCDSVLASDFCVLSDNTPKVNEYIAGSEGLRDLGFDSLRLLRRVTRDRTLTKRWRKRLKRRHRNNLSLTEQVPTTQTVCTNMSEQPS
jgi:hypothetical protein